MTYKLIYHLRKVAALQQDAISRGALAAVLAVKPYVTRVGLNMREARQLANNTALLAKRTQLALQLAKIPSYGTFGDLLTDGGLLGKRFFGPQLGKRRNKVVPDNPQQMAWNILGTNPYTGLVRIPSRPYLRNGEKMLAPLMSVYAPTFYKWRYQGADTSRNILNRFFNVKSWKDYGNALWGTKEDLEKDPDKLPVTPTVALNARRDAAVENAKILAPSDPKERLSLAEGPLKAAHRLNNLAAQKGVTGRWPILSIDEDGTLQQILMINGKPVKKPYTIIPDLLIQDNPQAQKFQKILRDYINSPGFKARVKHGIGNDFGTRADAVFRTSQVGRLKNKKFGVA